MCNAGRREATKRIGLLIEESIRTLGEIKLLIPENILLSNKKK